MEDNRIKKSRFLVTGGAGFIGSHLVTELLQQGAESVIALDHLRCGSWDNLIEAKSQFGHRLRLVEMDLGQVELAGKSLASVLEGVDFIYHLAAEKHNQAKADPELILNANVIGTTRLLQAATVSGVRKIVFTSSLYAYGRRNKPEMIETENPQPNTIYGVSKLAGEQLLRTFYEQAGLAYTAARLFFIYGPRQLAGMGYKSVILSNFERILTGQAPVIYGDGQQALDYTYITDAVNGLLASLTSAANGVMINLGSATPTTINDLTTLMLEVADSDLKPVYGPADWSAGTYRVCDNRQASQLLGWQPQVSLRSGLEDVYRWLRHTPQALLPPR